MTMRYLLALLLSAAAVAPPPDPIVVDTPMAPPAWAMLERRLLAENPAACREFFEKYYDARGYLQAFVRWGANDGPDDAFENFNRWPELHALGADDEILRLYLRAHDGMIRQYSEAKTTDVPAGRQGMYVNEFSAQSDWMHHGEGLQLFNRMALSAPDGPAYRDRVQRFAGLYMGEDPAAPNYDPKRKLIRSMINGSTGPMLRPATALDWVGDPFDTTGFVALHGESTFAQFLDHYREYTDVAGDHFLNLVATTLPTECVHVHGRREVPALARGVHGRVARSHEAERRDHSELRRSRRVRLAGRRANGGGTPTAGASARSIRSPDAARIATGFRARSSASATRCSSPAIRNTSTPGAT